jgi:methyltransferase (TIGR00027 family)
MLSEVRQVNQVLSESIFWGVSRTRASMFFNQLPSRAAISVAAHLLLLAQDAKFTALVPSESIAHIKTFLAECPGLAVSRLRFLLNNPWGSAYLRKRTERIAPGVSLAYALRKRWIEDQVRAAIASGCQQVVILGGGFDTLAYRLHDEFPNVRWWEIDHPTIQTRKRSVLIESNDPALNYVLYPGQLSTLSLTEILRSLYRYTAEKPTVFVAESIFPFMASSHVKKILRAMHDNSSLGSVLISTTFNHGTDAALYSEGVSLAGNVEAIPEWYIQPGQIPTFMCDNGFVANTIKPVYETLSAYYPDWPSIQMPRGEFLVAAIRL